MSERRECILNTASNLMSDFLYYDRKGSRSLPLNAIEEAIVAGEVSVDEIVRVMRDDLERAVKDLDQNKRVPL